MFKPRRRRSSSPPKFRTLPRVVRVFAAEFQLAYDFHAVLDLRSLDAEDYGGNPALRVPVLRTERGTWFGALNICRELSRISTQPARMVWPEQLEGPLLANAQELTLQAMATEVSWIMAKATAAADHSVDTSKIERSLRNMLDWLEANADEALALLPAAREISYFEITLACLVTHLHFREVLPITPYAGLCAFSERIAERPSFQTTPFRFDPRPPA